MWQGLREGSGRAACGASACLVPGSSPSCHPTERWPCQGKGKGHPRPQRGSKTRPERFEARGGARGTSNLVQTRLELGVLPPMGGTATMSPLLGARGELSPATSQATRDGQGTTQGSLSLEPGPKQGGTGCKDRVTSLLGQFWVQQVCSSSSNTRHTLQGRGGKKHRAAFPHHTPQHAATTALGMLDPGCCIWDHLLCVLAL